MKFNDLIYLIEVTGLSDFKYLPERPPYGFMVFPDGTFVPVTRVGGHASAAATTQEGIYEILMKGGVRMSSVIGDEYTGEVIPNRTSSSAKKTAKDLAQYYQYQIVFEPYQAYVTESNKKDILSGLRQLKDDKIKRIQLLKEIVAKLIIRWIKKYMHGTEESITLDEIRSLIVATELNYYYENIETLDDFIDNPTDLEIEMAENYLEQIQNVFLSPELLTGINRPKVNIYLDKNLNPKDFLNPQYLVSIMGTDSN